MPKSRNGRRLACRRCCRRICAQPRETPASMARRAFTFAGEDGLFVLGSLGVEELPAGHGDDAGWDAGAVEFFAGLDRQADLGAGGDEDQFRLQPFCPICLRLRPERIRLCAGRRRRRISCGRSGRPFAVKGRRRSGRSVLFNAARHASRTSWASQGRMRARFGIARRAARCSTDWCVGPSSPRPIESCVKTNIDLNVREGREADRRTHVIGKRLERSAERNNAAVQGHAVHRRAHRVFADAEMDIAVRVPLGLKIG